jgi:hypothetical protein
MGDGLKVLVIAGGDGATTETEALRSARGRPRVCVTAPAYSFRPLAVRPELL